jgi:hypothetical protein
MVQTHGCAGPEPWQKLSQHTPSNQKLLLAHNYRSKLFPALKYNAVRVYKAVEVRLRAFQSSALYEGEWSVCPPGTHWTGSWWTPNPIWPLTFRESNTSA